MILTRIQKNLERSKQVNFLSPTYESYCFSNIPSAVSYLFGGVMDTPLADILAHAEVNGGQARKVVLILIDGFGYRQWMRYASGLASLRRFVKRGVVAPLTAVFPSTTAAALTTIHSGLTPQEHGLPEWRVYFEEIGKAILTLPFTPARESGKDTLLHAGIHPRVLFDRGKTIYTQLSSLGVPSYIFLRNTYAHSAYSSVVHRGGTVMPYVGASDLFVNVRKQLEYPGRAYLHVYWDALDSMGHKYGPGSEQYIAELSNFLYSFQKELLDKSSGSAARETVILLTADHGQVPVNPQDTIYLNRYRTVTRHLKTDRQGNKILPWGSPRDVFLAVDDARVDLVIAYLSRLFTDRATVMRTEEALKDGLFGHGAVHRQFKSRTGNILILPHGNVTVWYQREDRILQKRGMHGGLHVDEMLVPFAVAKMSSLKRSSIR